MEHVQSRSYKLDLLISKRRRQTLVSSIKNDKTQPQTQREMKKVSHRKMIYLTVASKQEESRPKISSNPQAIMNKLNNSIAVSQFHIEIPEAECQKNKLQDSEMLNSVRQIQPNEVSDVWWKYLKYSNDDSRVEMLTEIARKQKKIQYFIDLLKENSEKFQAQKKLKVEKYESFLNKLKQLYLDQLHQAAKLFQSMQQNKDEEFYCELRLKINKDGKRGLNFSPKRMSLLSGINDTLLLSKKTSGSQQKRRSCDQFSFGSSLRKKSIDIIQIKSIKRSAFLDEGRIGIYKKRLNFPNS